MPKSKKSTLVVDVGGNKVKMKCSTEIRRLKFKSGPTLTAEDMCHQVIAMTAKWRVDQIAIGCPGPVIKNTLAAEPVNLAPGWAGFDFEKAFGKPVKVVNDALMQAIGSHHGGKMLFMGLGTGLGTCMVTDKEALPLEMAHLPYRDGLSFEDCVGRRGLARFGEEAWLTDVFDITAKLKDALIADYVVIGGGNSKKLPPDLPHGVELGDNKNAFAGGFRLWQAGGK